MQVEEREREHRVCQFYMGFSFVPFSQLNNITFLFCLSYLKLDFSVAAKRVLTDTSLGSAQPVVTQCQVLDHKLYGFQIYHILG